MPARPERHPEFEHTALYHDGHDDLAGQLAPTLVQALGRGHAVMVCSSADAWQHIRTQVGSAGDQIEYVPDGVRFGRPNVAMRIVHDFVRDRAGDGATAVCSVGAIPFNGDAAHNAEWLRYESAVGEVLQHLPLRAVCTYDVSLTPHDVLEAARAAHSNGHAGALAVMASGSQPIVVPGADPLIRLQVHSSRSARHTVGEAYRELIDDDALADLMLIVSEVVTNALTHGDPPVTLSSWFDASTERSVVDVADCGRGIDDPFVDLRPPRQGPGGAGMWIVGQLSDRVTTHRVDGVHHVTVALGHRQPTA